MAIKPTQEQRFATLETPLGKDALVLLRFEGSEGLGELFEYRIEALSADPIASFNPAIGANCSVSFKTEDGSKRYFNGTLVETQWIGTHDIYFRYRLVLRPWLWMLAHESDCRFFQEKSIPDIIKEVFGEHGFAKYEAKLNGNYPVIKYCVQYRESDFNFVSRLMEEAGIYYYFKHDEHEHTMMLADQPSCHEAKQGGAKLRFGETGQSAYRDEEALLTWFPSRRFASGRAVLNDYDFMKPTASLKAENEGGGSYQNAKLESYDYPGRYYEKDLGDDYAKVRLEAMQAADHRCQASGHAVTCCPGGLMELAEHPDSAQNGEYLIVRASHTFVSDAYFGTTRPETERVYSGQYEFLPKDIPFHNIPHTPKPIVHGPQTAVVAGDGEIDVDEDGRILVKFHWDRKKEDSCRIRVAQMWSSKKWGTIFIPRVGMEVVVEYFEGDPDRPLITGAVYNHDNETPYDLPQDKTIAGIKSNSSEGGGGYNELIFDDDAGHELIRLHAQYDMEGKIENDERREIKHDVTVKVGNDRTENIGQTWSVEAGMKIEFKVGASSIIMDPMSITIKSPTITIKADGLLDASAPLTQVSGSAILTLQGGLVKIN